LKNENEKMNKRKVENKMLQVNVTEEKALRIAPLAVGPLN
jgi:hypothetical protein